MDAVGGDIVAGLTALLPDGRPAPEAVAAARDYLRKLLPGRLPDLLAALDELARPLRQVTGGDRIPDPDDRALAVRFTLALHELEAGVLAGRLSADDVPNDVYAELAGLEDAVVNALPPRGGGRSGLFRNVGGPPGGRG